MREECEQHENVDEDDGMKKTKMTETQKKRTARKQKRMTEKEEEEAKFCGHERKMGAWHQ